jgi:4-amino-4-deoxy-L-arabinose transferase-like glycosyltransferase
MAPASARFLGLSPAAAALAVIALMTALRLWYAAWLPLLPDEAYYLQWSHHLDASYFSKGPAVAYTIWAGRHLFGETNLGVRFFAIALSAGTAWQLFLLARRWFDETTALLAVLLAGMIPLYAVGAVVMTIDPLSAFFWIWAANLFSAALEGDRWSAWILTGFAVGCGFLAKYLNALELVAFAAFLALTPARRMLFLRPRFWVMLMTALVCTLPVLWWNQHHGWITAGSLKTRGHLNGPFEFHPADFADFLGAQAAVISPLLFISLLAAAWRAFSPAAQDDRTREGTRLLLVLFLSVFGFYAVLALHMRNEPNWPAVSYLSMAVLLAAWWRGLSPGSAWQKFAFVALGVAWLETVVLHNPQFLHLPARQDPIGRTVGWSEIAAHLDQLRREQHAEVLIADAYKEAAIFSFYLPEHPLYTLRSDPPANQYDLWPKYPTDRITLWIAAPEQSPRALAADFSSIVPLEHIVIYFHGQPFRQYIVYRCENRG